MMLHEASCIPAGSCQVYNGACQQHAQALPEAAQLWAGGQKGAVQVFDLTTGQQAAGFQAASDTVNGFSFHPYLPLAATASGEPPNKQCCFDSMDLLLFSCLIVSPSKPLMYHGWRILECDTAQ